MVNEIIRSNERLKYALSNLMFEAEKILRDNDTTGVRRGDCGDFSATESGGEYSIYCGQERVHSLVFNRNLEVIQAQINWGEGDREQAIDSEEEATVATDDFIRQQAEGRKLLRFGNRKFDQITLLIDETELPGFVESLLATATQELSNPSEG